MQAETLFNTFVVSQSIYDHIIFVNIQEEHAHT